MSKIDKTLERELFWKLADGGLTAEQFAVVEQRLLSDAGFRERYVRAIDVEAGMYEAFNFPGNFRVEMARKTFLSRRLSIAAACAIVLFGCWFWISNAPHLKIDPVVSVLPALKPVAIVTQVQQGADSAGSSFKPGTQILPGVLSVDGGQVQIEFLNGVQINIEGPAELHILSVDTATLVSGKAAVRVPLGTRGFVLNTPDAAIVDQGTEFAVSVGKQGTSEVQVVDGMIDVSLLGNDGNTLTSERLTESKSLRVNRNPTGLEPIDAPSVVLPKIQKLVLEPLRVTEAYVRSIRASRPAIYWRFEKLVEGCVPNEISPRWAGRIHAAPNDSSGIVVRDGVARFTPSDHPHRLESDEVIAGFNHESFTVEFWISLDNFHWATLVAVVPEGATNSARSLSLIESLVELPYKSSLVYSPGSFRFLYRHPASDMGGTNVFSDRDSTPGLWHHLVAIKTPDGMKLYLNSKLVRHFAETEACDEDSYRLYVGELYEDRLDRQLSGAIAEFSVYLRALNDEEISEHYHAMTTNRLPNSR